MRIALYYHSLVSDWNHGNAHFLRGVVSELLARGHDVRVWEPADGWSRRNLLADAGPAALARFARAFPRLSSRTYDPASADVAALAGGADLAIVHEWNPPELVAALGRLRRRRPAMRLLFHDTHHRSVTARGEMAGYDLRRYDGVLAFGGVIRDIYLREGWASRAWTWHEAADVRTFRPLPPGAARGDLVWIGNWGDGERADELREFLLEPVSALGLSATVHGVRYPPAARRELRLRGIRYRGYLPNHAVPRAFARHRVTVHVPRRPYVEALPGIPTIRPFEALACGIPLVSAPWCDAEGLFTPGRDYLVARNGREMARQLRRVLHDERLAARLAAHGRRTILARHTCAHRVDELLAICAQLGLPAAPRPRRAAGLVKGTP
jgi:spore maturation protein CgeB